MFSLPRSKLDVCVPNKQNKHDLSPKNLIHILKTCDSYYNIRQRLLSEIFLLCQRTKKHKDCENILKDKNKLCQLILDPVSMNLNSRVNIRDPLVQDFFKISRDLCYSIHTKRMNILKNLKEKSQNN